MVIAISMSSMHCKSLSLPLSSTALVSLDGRCHEIPHNSTLLDEGWQIEFLLNLLNALGNGCLLTSVPESPKHPNLKSNQYYLSARLCNQSRWINNITQTKSVQKNRFIVSSLSYYLTPIHLCPFDNIVYQSITVGHSSQDEQCSKFGFLTVIDYEFVPVLELIHWA